ncbi:hypothetical protein BZA05DRAFT_38004 [Tricharina praecox]|uniref:uncharacterized protein n=1 Tax=Tricharina praecox TaxID=43433 RepID=UPI00221F6DC7|nr:uncharacterized protein BZA05DRAFT_38004 [Tricharina praecox]KAI5852179.1 hypothetical protein BZA05DRAFT_38004 [Tricharina praecox]
MSYLSLPAGFAPFIHVANFTMTTTTTTTTSTVLAGPLAGPLAAAAGMSLKPSKTASSGSGCRRVKPAPSVPLVASTPTPTPTTTPVFAPTVYAGHKRGLPVGSEASEPKRQRRYGAFRPRKHSRARVTGPRSEVFVAEPRFDVAESCVLGKRRGRIADERGLKARVRADGRLHFVLAGEEEGGEEETGFEEQLRRVEEAARGRKLGLEAFPTGKDADVRAVFELGIREAETAVPMVAIVEKPVVEEPVPEKVVEQPKPTPKVIITPSSPTESVHNDCPTEDDEDSLASPPQKAKSVLSKIGSLKGFKNAVTKAGSRVLKWKERKEKKEEEKKAAADEKKIRKAKKAEKVEKAKKEVESEDTEEEVREKKEKSLRSRLKSKKEKKTARKSTAGEDSEDEDKPKRSSRSTKDVRRDDSGDETEVEKPQKKSAKDEVKEEKVKEEEKKAKKEAEREEEYKSKKRLSVSSIGTVRSLKEEKKEEAKSSATSIQDVDMLSYAASLAETKSILEEMDLDDAATIRGGDDEQNGHANGVDDDASKQLQSEVSIEDDASDSATIREKPESKGDNKDEKEQDSGSSVRTVKRAILAVLSPPSDMLTPPPTPPLGCSSTKTGDESSHWISYKATGCQGDKMSDSDQTVWKETWSSGKKSLHRRLSAIFKKTLEDNQMDQFNPLNISRHAYRDSWCRDDDDDTECDANSILTLTVPSPPEHMDYCAWDTDAYELTPIDSCRERVESFNIAF